MGSSQRHAHCYKDIPQICSFGNLEPIYLPPHAISIPRTEVPMEAIIGVQVRRRDPLTRESRRKKMCCFFFVTLFHTLLIPTLISHVPRMKWRKRKERTRILLFIVFAIVRLFSFFCQCLCYFFTWKFETSWSVREICKACFIRFCFSNIFFFRLSSL